MKNISKLYRVVFGLIGLLFCTPLQSSYAAIVKLTHTVIPQGINPVLGTVANKATQYTTQFYKMGLDAAGLSYDAFMNAYKGFEKLLATGKLKNKNIISIIDFTKPSTAKRLFVIDVNTQKIILQTYVAHGRNSGTVMAADFSNKPESYKSSLGFYVTDAPYQGANGFSLHLNGVEKGFNDNAYKRAIVVHGADYVNENLIHEQGYIGRSYGCPAVPTQISRQLIHTIQNGSCLFIYAADSVYLHNSTLLKAS